MQLMLRHQGLMCEKVFDALDGDQPSTRAMTSRVPVTVECIVIASSLVHDVQGALQRFVPFCRQ